MHVGYDGPLKPKAMVEFLEREFIMIEDQNKFIDE
jgi:hypothetical protein